jgi:hypothetical protein
VSEELKSRLIRPKSGRGTLARDLMTQSIYNILKAPSGWSVHHDGVSIGGNFGSKEAALEAATVAATLAVRDGAGIQINVPGEPSRRP